MTPEMKQFLLELADLMDKHGVSEMEIDDSTPTRNYETPEIYFTMPSEFDGNHNMIKDFCITSIGKWNNPDSLRKEASE